MPPPTSLPPRTPGASARWRHRLLPAGEHPGSRRQPSFQRGSGTRGEAQARRLILLLLLHRRWRWRRRRFRHLTTLTMSNRVRIRLSATGGTRSRQPKCWNLEENLSLTRSGESAINRGRTNRCRKQNSSLLAASRCFTLFRHIASPPFPHPPTYFPLQPPSLSLQPAPHLPPHLPDRALQPPLHLLHAPRRRRPDAQG